MEELPSPEKLAELFTFSFTEVESVEKRGGDSILDLKILPDRACYALSHRGVAQELFAVLRLPFKINEKSTITVGDTRNIECAIEEENLCRRHISRIIENIKIETSPKWLRERLEAISQRSINNIIDATNFVTLDMGQPLHAFDADKIKGKVTIRPGKVGETVVTLDGKTITLDSSIMVIADEEGPLDIAGIKGGKKAELDENTKTILLSVANFDPTNIRKTSTKTGLKTDASKRFENNLTPEKVKEGMDEINALISELCPRAIFGKETDIYPKKTERREMGFSPDAIRSALGENVSDDKIRNYLLRLGISNKKNSEGLIADIPFERTDLTIPENITEEIGRLYGYEKIPSKLPQKQNEATKISKPFYWQWKIRETLVGAGFSEIMTSSFSKHGDREIEKPLAEDKKYARATVRDGFSSALKMNTLNAPLFGSSEVNIFEIGSVFPKEGERTALALGCLGAKKQSTDKLSSTLAILSHLLGGTLVGEIKENIFECELDSIIKNLPEPTSFDINLPKTRAIKYIPFSPYPYIVRDIALFVPLETESEQVLLLIQKEAGDFLVRAELFDRFEKDGKISYAFRMVFQSANRTLTDEEINEVMKKISTVMLKQGWQVR